MLQKSVLYSKMVIVRSFFFAILFVLFPHIPTFFLGFLRIATNNLRQIKHEIVQIAYRLCFL